MFAYYDYEYKRHEMTYMYTQCLNRMAARILYRAACTETDSPWSNTGPTAESDIVEIRFHSFSPLH